MRVDVFPRWAQVVDRLSAPAALVLVVVVVLTLQSRVVGCAKVGGGRRWVEVEVGVRGRGWMGADRRGVVVARNVAAAVSAGGFVADNGKSRAWR